MRNESHGEEKRRLETWVNRTVEWIQKKVEAAGCSGVVFGMSGGVDSSVVAALCRRAFPEASLGLCLPCRSDPQDLQHAGMVAAQLDLETATISLDAPYEAFLSCLPERFRRDGSTIRAADGNVKARMRMVAWYFVANVINSLVVGSGNAAELHVGYYTKYGDGGVDLMPLARLTKGQVCLVARHLGLPRQVLDKPPSAGLWPGQTDEGEMGLTYAELDRYLLTGTSGSDADRSIERRHRASAHKRATPAIPGFTLSLHPAL